MYMGLRQLTQIYVEIYHPMGPMNPMGPMGTTGPRTGRGPTHTGLYIYIYI